MLTVPVLYCTDCQQRVL